MQIILPYLVVFMGAGIGGALRHGVNVFAMRYLTANLPAGTWLVNIVGCAAIGALAGLFAFRVGIGQHWQLFLVTGILGGFTTFSAFSLDTVLLYERGQIGMAIGYVVTSVGCSVCATVLALSVVRALE